MDRKKIRSQLHRKYGGKCAYCGSSISLKDLTIDHIYPSSMGGSDDPENINPCCSTCNEFKKDLTVDEFRDEITNQLDITKNKKWFALLSNYTMIYIKETPVIFHFEKESNV